MVPNGAFLFNRSQRWIVFLLPKTYLRQFEVGLWLLVARYCNASSEIVWWRLIAAFSG
jgi:hypothetical protein